MGSGARGVAAVLVIQLVASGCMLTTRALFVPKTTVEIVDAPRWSMAR